MEPQNRALLCIVYLPKGNFGPLRVGWVSTVLHLVAKYVRELAFGVISTTVRDDGRFGLLSAFHAAFLSRRHVRMVIGQVCPVPHPSTYHNCSLAGYFEIFRNMRHWGPVKYSR